MNSLDRYAFVLKNFEHLPSDLKKLITGPYMSDQMLKLVAEICYNILKQNVEVTQEQKNKLKRYKSSIKLLSAHKVGQRSKRKILKKLTGKGLLPLLFSIVAPLVSGAVASTLSN